MVKSKSEYAKDKYVGVIYETNNYGSVQVMDYINRDTIHVTFLNTGYETTASLGNLKKGSIQDWSLPSVCGVG